MKCPVCNTELKINLSSIHSVAIDLGNGVYDHQPPSFYYAVSGCKHIHINSHCSKKEAIEKAQELIKELKDWKNGNDF